MTKSRDTFTSKIGFVLSCAGAAIGCGNIWRFPIMVSKYGGLTYIIPYIIFVILITNSGLMEEFALGRAAASGPVGAFGMCTSMRGFSKKSGSIVGIIPLLGSVGLAIGYTCVFGWIIKYAVMSVDGQLFSLGTDMDTLGTMFGAQTASAMSNNAFIIIAAALAACVMIFGIANGIEKANKILMPALFVLLIGLAVYISTLDGALNGYRYIFSLNVKGLLNPETWIYAFGMAFFSLCVAGNGCVIYGSYLKEDEDIPRCAARIAVFDTLASILATLVILPAMASAGIDCSSSGPGLIFIYLVNVFNSMALGRIIGIIFFVLFTFAALTSIINLYEVSVSFVNENVFKSRALSAIIMLGIGAFAAIFIQGIASDWMDVVNNYICPLGALLAAIMYFYVAGDEFALNEVNRGASKKCGKAFLILGKYVFCPCALIALVAGVLLGGIG